MSNSVRLCGLRLALSRRRRLSGDSVVGLLQKRPENALTSDKFHSTLDVCDFTRQPEVGPLRIFESSMQPTRRSALLGRESQVGF